jgi:hypothetical protein
MKNKTAIKILENKEIYFKDFLYWIYRNLSKDGVLRGVVVRNCVIKRIPVTDLPFIKTKKVGRRHSFPIYVWDGKLCGYKCERVTLRDSFFNFNYFRSKRVITVNKKLRCYRCKKLSDISELK